ncbi:MAG: hypothetical protein V1493_04630 [Candidatus Diapherotrites archaeon]
MTGPSKPRKPAGIGSQAKKTAAKPGVQAKRPTPLPPKGGQANPLARAAGHARALKKMHKGIYASIERMLAQKPRLSNAEIARRILAEYPALSPRTRTFVHTLSVLAIRKGLA